MTPRPTNVFISWSGEPSKAIAVALREWLPTVLQAAVPFMSDRDIDAGKRGLIEIAEQLQGIKIGIFCVTANNQGAPWLNFEAGALSRLISESHVIPLAFDIESGQVKLPLGQFQAKQFTQDEISHTLKTINRALGSTVPGVSFRRGWPELHQTIESLRLQQKTMEAFEEPPRTAENMLEELIVSMRDQAATLKHFSPRSNRPSVMVAHFLATESTLRKLALDYDIKPPLSAQQFLDLAEQYDESDWALIENTPFLKWYLTELRNMKRPKAEAQDVGSAPNDFDDVPF